MRITTATRIQNNAWRYNPETGFLRCTASILCAGVMTYQHGDLEGAAIPEHLTGEVRLYVSPEELSSPESISTLEGMPAVIGHVWQTAGAMSACGNIAGTPTIQGDHLVADILITDPTAVRRIMLPEGDPERLQEISSAGDWSIVWEPGVTDGGEPYDGFFVNMTYNHSALLPAGAGRAGASVRIINTKEVAKMDFTNVRLRNGKSVRVANEDVDKLMEADAAAEQEVKNAITPEQLTEALEELTALKEETKVKTDRIAELEGMVQAYKDQLDAALSPEQIEEAAEVMNEEREEATAVMNAHGLQVDDATKKMRGHGLRTKVVNSVRVKNGKPELAADDLKDEGYVKGMYKALVELSASAKPAVVAGANVVTIQNDKGEPKVVNMSNNAERAARLYGKK